MSVESTLLANFLFTAIFWACVTFSAEFVSVTYPISLCHVHGRLTTISVAAFYLAAFFDDIDICFFLLLCIILD